jgi:hydrogenase maturation protease
MNSTTSVDSEEKLSGYVRGKRLVILFVGNTSRGDDGAPQLLFRNIRLRLTRIRLLDCGTSPQDCIEEVAEREPDVVIFVNAVDRSLPPGAVVVEELQATRSTDSSLVSHKFPLAWVAMLLKTTCPRQEPPIRTILIGIQIGSTKGRVTAPVRKSMNRLCQVLMKMDSNVVSFT